MNKFEALEALEKGRRVTHNNLVNHKWLKLSEDKKHYEFDNGETIKIDEFWELRNLQFEWGIGWSIADFFDNKCLDWYELSVNGNTQYMAHNGYFTLLLHQSNNEPWDFAIIKWKWLPEEKFFLVRDFPIIKDPELAKQAANEYWETHKQDIFEEKFGVFI